MSTRESILRYFHITNRLRKSPATFEEINNYLTQQSEFQGYKFNVSKRQFQRDLSDIGSIFEIDINYDFSRQVYAINEELQSEISQRRLEAFDTFNALKIGENTSKSIHFEKRRPRGTEHLFGLLHAINNNLQVRFTYHKFWEDEPTFRTVEPLALKEFKNRWYLIARQFDTETSEMVIKTFGLDRLTALNITRTQFKNPDNFDIEEQFRDCFGIITGNGDEPQEVILSFDADQGKYIKSLPLHESQQIIVDNDNELQIKLFLYITYDFEMELLTHGEHVKVLKPESLIEKMKQSYFKALTKYQVKTNG
jgi:predicted DNA-binding transcriptional regulator YafY